MKRRLLKKGDRIRLKVRLMSGWKGFGTVALDQVYTGDDIEFYPDEPCPPHPYYDSAVVSSHEVVLLRNQSPPIQATKL